MKAIIDGLIVLPNEIINGHVIMYEKDIWRIVPRKQFRAACARNSLMPMAASSYRDSSMNTSTAVPVPTLWMTMTRP